ncbi:MAG: hypothetical protein VW456_11585, partial [Alphaproteobacteria bacterium]
NIASGGSTASATTDYHYARQSAKCQRRHCQSSTGSYCKTRELSSSDIFHFRSSHLFQLSSIPEKAQKLKLLKIKNL